MSNRSEQRDVRLDHVHFKNKYKFMILKQYHDAINNPGIFGSKSKYESYIPICIRVLF